MLLLSSKDPPAHLNKNIHCRASLRLVVAYIEEVYPSRVMPTGGVAPSTQSSPTLDGAPPPPAVTTPSQTVKSAVTETPKLAECVFEVRSLLQQILTDTMPELARRTDADSKVGHLK